MFIQRGSLSIERQKKEGIPMFFLTAYCFLYLFLPPIVDISILTLLTVFNVVFIFGHCFIRRKIVINREPLGAILGFVIYILLFYLLQIIHYISDTSHQKEIAAFTQQNTLTIIHTIVACFFLAVLCKYYGLTIYRFLTAITLAGTLQLVLVIVSLTVPSIRTLFTNMIVSNVRSARLSEAVNTYLYLRSYGFASNLFDGFGYVTALIIVLTFLHGVSKKRKIVTALSLVMIIMPLLNSRTGLILSAFGILIVLLIWFRSQNVMRYLFGGIFVVLLLVFISRIVPESTFQWASRGIAQTFALITGGEKTGVYAEILQADIHFPPDFFLGMGCDPNNIGLSGIDSGYIQCIWRHGLLGTIVLFGAFLYYFLYFGKRFDEKMEKTIIIVLPLLLFTYLVKISGFENAGGNFIIFGTPIVAYFSLQKNDFRRDLILK